MPIIIKVLIYAAICVFIENLSSGIWRLVSKQFTPEQKKQGLMWSYLYMLPVYLIFPFTFELFFKSIDFLSWYLFFPIIYIFGVVFITLIETVLGFLCEKIIGFCPWGRYSKEQHGIFGGYSRWDISLTFGLLSIGFYFIIKLLEYI